MQGRNRFEDPTGVTPSYEWHINHSDEESNTISRNIERTALVGGTHFIRQQGDRSPIVCRWTGTILHKAQMQAFVQWEEKCQFQTIYLREFSGDKWEIFITRFDYQRHRTVKNPRDPSIPYFYWTYTLEFEVLDYFGVDNS